MTNKSFDTVLDRMLTLSRAMDDTLGDRAGDRAGSRGSLWLPPVDIYETEHSFVVEADLPGFRSEDVDLRFEQNTLTIRGSRDSELPRGERNARVFSMERPAGAFTRSIRLPEYVDGERIEANLANGVLRVDIPKAQTALPRKIEARVGGRGDARRVESGSAGNGNGNGSN